MQPPPPPAGPPPQQPPQPPQPPQQPQQPQSAIALTLQGSVLTSNAITPKVTFNNWPVPASYGLNVIPVPPGPLRIHCYAQWMRQYGQATLDVDVPPGQTVPVFYAAPMHQFTTGAIGHTQQKRPGVAVFWAILGVPLLLVLLIIVLATAL